MSDEQDPRGAGGPPAGGAHRAAAPAPDAEFRRPDGVDGGFAPRAEPPRYTPPPPTVSPQERAVFGRPASGGSFAPAPGERLGPRPTETSAVPPMFADAFGRPPRNREGFDPAPRPSQ